MIDGLRRVFVQEVSAVLREIRFVFFKSFLGVTGVIVLLLKDAQGVDFIGKGIKVGLVLRCGFEFVLCVFLGGKEVHGIVDKVGVAG